MSDPQLGGGLLWVILLVYLAAYPLFANLLPHPMA